MIPSVAAPERLRCRLADSWAKLALGRPMSERAPRGMIAFAVSEGLVGGLLLAVGGVNAFMWLSYALS
jgi:hypothetical protein